MFSFPETGSLCCDAVMLISQSQALVKIEEPGGRVEDSNFFFFFFNQEEKTKKRTTREERPVRRRVTGVTMCWCDESPAGTEKEGGSTEKERLWMI